jgi:hypothetical protein
MEAEELLRRYDAGEREFRDATLPDRRPELHNALAESGK